MQNVQICAWVRSAVGNVLLWKGKIGHFWLQPPEWQHKKIDLIWTMDNPNQMQSMFGESKNVKTNNI